MRLLCCVALFLISGAQAGELLPVEGDESEAVQEALDEFALSAVQALDPAIKVAAIVEDAKLSGRAKRIFLGPLAGDSRIRLRIKILDGEDVAEALIEGEAGNWAGTFRPGEDSEMLELVATRAAEFIRSYQRPSSPSPTD